MNAARLPNEVWSIDTLQRNRQQLDGPEKKKNVRQLLQDDGREWGGVPSPWTTLFHVLDMLASVAVH